MNSYNLLSFKEYQEAYQAKKSLKDKIMDLVNNPDFIMFFCKNDEVFGATEDERVTFARLKNPDDDDSNWNDEADFTAINLSRLLAGELPQAIFGKKDLSKIHVISKEKAQQKLLHQSETVKEPKKSSDVIKIVMDTRSRKRKNV